MPDHESAEYGIGAGHGFHGVAVGNGCSNQTLAWIRDGRGAGIADNHDLLASAESIDHLWGYVMLGVLVAHAQCDAGDAQMA